MDKRGRFLRARETVLPLADVPVGIEWQAGPEEDVLARLLLDLIGEDELQEIFR